VSEHRRWCRSTRCESRGERRIFGQLLLDLVQQPGVDLEDEANANDLDQTHVGQANALVSIDRAAVDKDQAPTGIQEIEAAVGFELDHCLSA